MWLIDWLIFIDWFILIHRSIDRLIGWFGIYVVTNMDIHHVWGHWEPRDNDKLRCHQCDKLSWRFDNSCFVLFWWGEVLHYRMGQSASMGQKLLPRDISSHGSCIANGDFSQCSVPENRTHCFALLRFVVVWYKFVLPISFRATLLAPRQSCEAIIRLPQCLWSIPYRGNGSQDANSW